METHSTNPSVILINYLKNKPKPINIEFTLYSWWGGERTDELYDLPEGFNDEDFSIFINKIDFEIYHSSGREFTFSIRFEEHKGFINFEEGEIYESFSGDIRYKRLFTDD